MNENVRELKQRSGELHSQAGELLNKARIEKRTLSAVEQSKFDNLTAQIEALRADIERTENHASLDGYLSQSRGRRTDTTIMGATGGSKNEIDLANLAVRAWALGPRASKEGREAAERMGVDVDNPELSLRSLSVGAPTAGGHSVSDELIRAFDQAELWFGPMRSTSTVYQNQTGAPWPVPTFDDSGSSAVIVSEGAAIATTPDPLFGQSVLQPFQYASPAVVVSVQLLQDSAMPLPTVLGEALGARIGRKQNSDFTTGAGTTLPFGIVTGASLGKTCASTSTCTWDEIYDLQASVDPAYANRPGSGFMMSQATANLVRKIKDSQNRFIWTMDVQGPSGQGNTAGMAGRILGYPCWINNNMSSTFTTGQKLILFGDLKSYWICDAGPPILKRADELRLLTNEVVFVAFRRSDGALINSSAVKYLRLA